MILIHGQIQEFINSYMKFVKLPFQQRISKCLHSQVISKECEESFRVNIETSTRGVQLYRYLRISRYLFNIEIKIIVFIIDGLIIFVYYCALL